MSDPERVEGFEKAGTAGRSGRAAAVIGVLGAGTMGSGIAQLAARSGAKTLLYDPIPEALQRGLTRARDGLEKEAARGKLSAEDAAASAERLQTAESLEEFAPCELVIEAVPERIELKHDLYARLSQIVSAECVLASNTSSLLVTAIASAASDPERVVGMHFFNPAPVMRLLEVVAGEQSGERALQIAHATGEAMGKTVIRAHDGPGFLVNRCNRPFGLEALRLLQERIADVETIDRICRMHGGFRMGPFELMDLVGVDTGFEISKSFYEQSFGEPRWRPSMIAARYVAAGLHGRKSGRGYYAYPDGQKTSGTSYREQDPEPIEEGSVPGAAGLGGATGPAPPGAVAPQGVVVISGDGALADELRDAAVHAGYEVRGPYEPSAGTLPSLAIECEPSPARRTGEQHLAVSGRPDRRGTPKTKPGGARLLLCARGSLATLDPGGSAVGFHALPPLSEAKLVELTRNESSSPVAAERAERFFAALGKHVAWVGDAPGLVLGRIVCQIVNEASFALGEGVGDTRDIDLGMVLGLSHPRGPFEWADTIGVDHVLTVLDALHTEYREERYRPAPALRKLLAAGRLGRAEGAGFFEYED